MQRGFNNHRPAVVALTLLVGTATLALFGCSDGPDQQSCEAHEACPDGRICNLEDQLCVEPGGFECSEGDCPDGWVCNPESQCVEAEGAACELSGDCPGEYACLDGECGIQEFEDEDYRMSFTAERDQESSFVVADRQAELNEEIDTGDIDCHQARACRVTSDGSRLIAIRSSGETFEAVAAPMATDPPAVDGDVEVFAESIENPRMRGDGVAYTREQDDGTVVARFKTYDGEEVEVATLHNVDDSLSHVWDIDPETGRTLQIYPQGLRAASVRIGSMDQEITADDKVAELTMESAGQGVGSTYLDGSYPLAASDDGRLVAYSVVSVNPYGNCESHSDCSGTSRACGETGRCYAFETTIFVVDMEHADTLGEDCLGHDECGPVNRCDSGSEDFDGGQCAPQRIAVGLPETPQQPRVGPEESKTGCEATRQDGTFRFTDIQAPLNFGADDRIYFVGKRNCTRSSVNEGDDAEANIPRTSIAAADPFSGDYEEIFGNIEGQDFNSMGCSEQGAVADNLDECHLVFDDVRFSPQRNDFVLTASNPATPTLADDRLDVWNLQRGTENLRWIGGRSGAEVAVDLAVHSTGDAGEDAE